MILGGCICSIIVRVVAMSVGAVTITNARHMLFATVLADVARGIRFKTCKRKDCRKPFPIESEHKRDYCKPYCGHLVSLRKGKMPRRNGPHA